MSFALFTDSTANLTEAEYTSKKIDVVSLTLPLNEEEIVCYQPVCDG
jgi:fatty acid-binding protein DegV